MTELIGGHNQRSNSIPEESSAPLEILGDDWKFLRLAQHPHEPEIPGLKPTIRIVDLFCGAGGLSLGLHLAAHHLGFDAEVTLAVDNNPAATASFERNFFNANVKLASVEEFFSSNLEAPLSNAENALRDELGEIDLLVGGPPCQGHSDLNNYTRRDDPKNMLYLYMARAAVVLRPKAVLIENVVGSLHDKNGVVQCVTEILRTCGYHVDCDFLDFHTIGVPQKRRRLVIKASMNPHLSVSELQRQNQISERDLEWAIRDLVDAPQESLMDTPSRPKPATQQRIDYLFTHGLHELPNSERPPCHRNKKHSYDTVYGRLHWERPAQTITSGFYCMCMGRYVHPSLPRTLTAREAARIQFFPDYFDFSAAGSRTRIAELIGNAVPPKGAFLFGVDLVRSIFPSTLPVEP